MANILNTDKQIAIIAALAGSLANNRSPSRDHAGVEGDEIQCRH
jgi:hypothetical protein